MNDLHVHNQFPSPVVDDQDSNASSAISKGTIDPVEQTTLIHHGQTLLDVACLGHADDQTILADVQHAILLEDWAQHGLHDDGRGGIADEGALFVQLTGEQVDTKVSVLAGLGRHADADDLRGATLQQEDVANANEMALDWHSAATKTTFDKADLVDRSTRTCYASSGFFSALYDHLIAAAIGVVTVVRKWVKDAVSGTLDTATEAVVVPLVVVVTHVSSVRLIDRDLFLLNGDVGLQGTTSFVLDVVGGVGAAAEVSLGNV